MDLEEIQSIIDSDRQFENTGGFGFDQWVEVTREHFEVSLKAAKKAKAPSVPFLVDLRYSSFRVWFEWMTEVEGYVAIQSSLNGKKKVLVRVTKKNIDKHCATPDCLRFFPKGTTKEILERLLADVESVEW
jgi:hypothetical protein